MISKRTLLSLMACCAALLGAASASAQDDAPPGPGYILTPAGWTHKSCGQVVEDGSTVEEASDGSLRVSKGARVSRIAKCNKATKFRSKFFTTKSSGQALPTINGWLEYSWFWAPNNGGKNWMNRLDGKWVVPAAPTSNGATIFFFNSMEPSNGSSIIQPVLQYGPSAGGGGNDWRIASWYVKSDGTFAVSTLKKVNVGDAVTGNIVGTGCTSTGNCTWAITTKTGSQTTTLSHSAGTDVFKWVQPAVLEVYNVTTCSRLPNTTGTAFSDTFAYQPGAGSTQNSQRNEMATTLTWSSTVAAASPACDGYQVTNFERGTTLSY